MTTIKLGAVKLWPDRNVGRTQFAARQGGKKCGCTTFVARVPLVLIRSQDSCVRLFFPPLLIILGIVCGSWEGIRTLFAPSLEMPLVSK